MKVTTLNARIRSIYVDPTLQVDRLGKILPAFLTLILLLQPLVFHVAFDYSLIDVSN